LSWIPLVGFSAYPFFKRFTKWTHVGLGLVWSFIPLAGYFAVKPTLEGATPAILLGVFSIFWLAGFDIIYATMDEAFDKKAGLFSLPACWGAERAVRTAAMFHLLSFIVLLIIYGVWFSGPLTVMLLASIGVLLFLEQRYSHHVDLAFFKINAVIGFAIFFFVISGSKGF
jgi:4-hydroxybenzoate polyprenyltransferase